MENVGVNQTSAYAATKLRDDQNQQTDATKAAQAAQYVRSAAISDEATPNQDDTVDLSAASAAARNPAPAAPAQPQAPTVPVEAQDTVIPIDGRGAAVALQEKLQQALREDRATFDAIAQALDVKDLAQFADTVENGSAVAVFGQINDGNVLFADRNGREIKPEDVASTIGPQLVIKPGFAPVVAEDESSVELNPNAQIQQRASQPPTAAEIATDKATNPDPVPPKQDAVPQTIFG